LACSNRTPPIDAPVKMIGCAGGFACCFADGCAGEAEVGSVVGSF
jgi:hypothetical protein